MTIEIVKYGKWTDLDEVLHDAKEQYGNVGAMAYRVKQATKELEILRMDLDEAARCLERAIAFVHDNYGEDSEALADIQTATWKAIVKSIRERNENK